MNMDILEFTRAISTEAPGSGPSRWADTTRSALVEAVLHLAHYADEVPPELKAEYQRFLREAVESMPQDARLDMTRSLRLRLLDVAPQDIIPRLKRLVGEGEVTAGA